MCPFVVPSLIVAWTSVLTSPVLPSGEPIVHIDLYGLREVKQEVVLETLGVGVGDDFEFDREAVVARLEALPEVAEASVISMPMPGNGMLLVGLEEEGAVKLGLNEAPAGEVRLPGEFVELYDRILELSLEGIYAGQSREDHVEGYALSEYEPAREKELEMIELARGEAALLVRVLAESSDAIHRAVAADAIAALEDKALVQSCLAKAMRDQDSGVRNNATRALLVLSSWANSSGEFRVEVDATPAIEMLESVTWTDRNKASGLLYHLSEDRDPGLLDTLRERSVPALVEMALWHSDGHAFTSRMLLGRVAGLGEEDLKEQLAGFSREALEDWVFQTAERCRQPGS